MIMAQEAYRKDRTVPAEPLPRITAAKSQRRAHRYCRSGYRARFSLRYAPSMRNGGMPATAATRFFVRLDQERECVALPYVRQRRVAVAAELDGFPWMTFVGAHLDTHGHLRSPGASRAYVTWLRTGPGPRRAPGRRLGTEQTVLLGADWKSYLATREPMMRAFKSLGFQRIPHTPRRSSTFHSPPIRLLLDHIMVRRSRGRDIDEREAAG